MRTTTAKLLVFLSLLFWSIQLAALTRDDVIRNIAPYTGLSWTVESRNVINRCSSPTWTRTPFANGKKVPSEAYNWGGFSTPADFKSAIKGKAYAGNNCTSSDGNPYGIMNNTAGVDCSGFVARLWERSSKLATSSAVASSVTKATVAIRGGIANAKNTMRPGDVFLKDGAHVAMFVASTSNGPTVAEAVGGYWRVVQRTSAWSEWKTYEPRRYPGLQDAGLGKLTRLTAPTSVRRSSSMTVTITIKETDGDPVKYDDIRIALRQDGSSAPYLEMTALKDISFKGDQTRTLTFTASAPKEIGKYRIVARNRVGARWSDFAAIQPAANAVLLTVTK